MAPSLIGKLLCRKVKIDGKERVIKLRITETECYFGEARENKNNVSQRRRCIRLSLLWNAFYVEYRQWSRSVSRGCTY